jgi:hypothetical protein
VKWLVDLDDKLRVVAALAQALDLLELPRYAAICRSGTTREVLGGYETSVAHGKAAFRRAAAASGVVPPDLPDFLWGPAMGFEEASAWSSTAEFPAATAADPLPPLRWLLDQLDGGIALTQTGNLNRRFVQQNADRFGWDFSGPPSTEDELYDLHQLRHFAQDLGLARRSGRRLALTAKGRRLLADPDSLWRAVAAGLLGGNGFLVYAGELFLALLLDADSVPGRQINAIVGQATAEEGFRETRSYEPPDEHDISRAVHETSNLCRALGLFAVGGDWHDRSYGLTATGKSTALEALRARATGPRTVPWP